MHTPVTEGASIINWTYIISSRDTLLLLHHELVYGTLGGQNEARQLLVLISRHARSNNWPGNAAGPAQRSLGCHEYVGDVLHGTHKFR